MVLAHYYVDGAVRTWPTVGDSSALAQKAAEACADADIVVMCGVDFMADTVKLLCPDKKVLVPDADAGCSLADSSPPDAFADFIAGPSRHTVISYVNTSVAVKALSDVLVTSGNARRIVDSFPADAKLIFRARPQPRSIHQLRNRPRHGAVGRRLPCTSAFGRGNSTPQKTNTPAHPCSSTPSAAVPWCSWPTR